MDNTQAVIIYHSKTEQQQDEWMQKHPEVLYTIQYMFLFFVCVVFISVLVGFIGTFFTATKTVKQRNGFRSGLYSRLESNKPKPWYRKFF